MYYTFATHVPVGPMTNILEAHVTQFKMWSDHINANCAEEGKIRLKWQVFKYPN
jgi:hypothetical protein